MEAKIMTFPTTDYKDGDGGGGDGHAFVASFDGVLSAAAALTAGTEGSLQHSINHVIEVLNGMGVAIEVHEIEDVEE